MFFLRRMCSQCVACAFTLIMSVSARAAQIDVVEINDPITPVVAEYIIKSINEAEADQARCLIIQLDTPGGLDLAMRDIIKRIMASGVPVVVFVGPSGARAASAGALRLRWQRISPLWRREPISGPLSCQPGREDG